MQKPGLDIHLIAIGGTGMAPLACLLAEAGHRVRGSDGPLYPPMSTLLETAGIEPQVGFDPAHLDPRPDLVIVGNAVPRSNPEVEEVERLDLPKLSMPEALARYLLHDRQPLVIAGTHGKTTTTSLAAWVWEACGADPGYLIGGIPLNMSGNFRHGSGSRFIIEGDEYNAAYFDRGPKFLHYQAQTLILTSVEFDHADLYADQQAASDAFARLISSLPEDGLLVACGDSPGVRSIAHLAPCRTIYYGLGEHNDFHPGKPLHQDETGLTLVLPDEEEGDTSVFVPMHGEHNASNALAVWVAARADGIPAGEIVSALGRFAGVKRRSEVLGSASGVTVIDDFAHHPTAVRVTLEGLRARFPDSRLVAVFEPRSLTSAQNLFYDEYCEALSVADCVWLAPVFHAARFSEDERLDIRGIAGHLCAHGLQAFAVSTVAEILSLLPDQLSSGDVVVTMSSGSLEGLPFRLLERLQAQSPA